MSTTPDWVERTLRRREDLQVREIDGETVILDSAKERMHNLNATAAFIFSAIDERRPLREVCAEFAECFGVPLETAERDTKALVEQLIDLGLIVEGASA